jgi:hypothetical protein
MAKGQYVSYEWDILIWDANGVDIHDHDFIERLADCPLDQFKNVELVRDVGNEHSGMQDRQWLTMADWKTGEFDGGAKVPKRYIAEIQKYIETHALTIYPNITIYPNVTG